MIYNSIEQIFDDFKKGEIAYIDAIQALMDNFGYSGREAEALVESWEE